MSFAGHLVSFLRASQRLSLPYRCFHRNLFMQARSISQNRYHAKAFSVYKDKLKLDSAFIVRSITTTKGTLNSNDDSQFRNDPEIRGWLKEIESDFLGDKVPQSHTTNDSHETSSSSSDSDSSSDSSDSDSDSDVDTSSTETVSGDNEKQDIANITGSSLSSSSSEDIKIISKDAEEDYDYIIFEEDDPLKTEQHEVLVEEEPLPVELKRGKTGVFDIEELVAVLRNENLLDICVIRVPPEYQYVDYMVIATGRSTRHIRAAAELVRWVFKQKRSKGDPSSCKIEGFDTRDWMAMDLGNIAMHLFLEKTREMYDLETLWTVGAAFDEKATEQMEDPFAMYLNKESDFQSSAAVNSYSEENYIFPADDSDLSVLRRYNDRWEGDGEEEGEVSMESQTGWHPETDMGSAQKPRTVIIEKDKTGITVAVVKVQD